ncbi:hypothetical protein OS493_029698 [Desmophyllum pertusum]|uniref:Uncharacterized protein n=1 Tax=Desmophyllum pertusum TaxID=174260 RepID=A0A9X0CXR5_9CNID|nr:hypothetical protein OS493_029698 [Desmophyllum pertusum]
MEANAGSILPKLRTSQHFITLESLLHLHLHLFSRGPVRANEKTEITATFLAGKIRGGRNLSVNFNSNEISGVVGEKFINVFK